MYNTTEKKYYGMGTLEGWQVDGVNYTRKVPNSVINSMAEARIVLSDISISNRLVQIKGTSMLHVGVPYPMMKYYFSNKFRATTKLVDFMKKYAIGSKIIFDANIDYDALKDGDDTLSLGVNELIES